MWARFAGVPIENCLTEGVQSEKLGTNREQLGNKLPKNITLFDDVIGEELTAVGADHVLSKTDGRAKLLHSLQTRNVSARNL